MANWLKVAGIATSLAGAAVSIAADHINERKMKETIKEEVKREYAERFDNNEEEV